MRIQLRAPWLALSACRSFPALPSPAHPADGCCDPDPELNRRSPGWEARQRRVDHPVAQILTVGSRHARPPSNTGRATRILCLQRESPPDSEKTERALGVDLHDSAGLILPDEEEEDGGAVHGGPRRVPTENASASTSERRHSSVDRRFASPERTPVARSRWRRSRWREAVLRRPSRPSCSPRRDCDPAASEPGLPCTWLEGRSAASPGLPPEAKAGRTG